MGTGGTAALLTPDCDLGSIQSSSMPMGETVVPSTLSLARFCVKNAVISAANCWLCTADNAPQRVLAVEGAAGTAALPAPALVQLPAAVLVPPPDEQPPVAMGLLAPPLEKLPVLDELPPVVAVGLLPVPLGALPPVVADEPPAPPLEELTPPVAGGLPAPPGAELLPPVTHGLPAPPLDETPLAVIEAEPATTVEALIPPVDESLLAPPLDGLPSPPVVRLRAPAAALEPARIDASKSELAEGASER